MRKQRPFVKELGGLSPRELEAVINILCEEGEFKSGFSYSSLWTHDFLGIPINLEHFMDGGFKLYGDQWSLTFKSRPPPQPWENPAPLGKLGADYFYAVVGPLQSAHYLHMTRGPRKKNVLMHKFRRRGSRERYRHDFSIIRLCL